VQARAPYLKSQVTPAYLPVPTSRKTIQLGDGTKLTFLGTTYGRHHVAPHYENLRTGNWIDTAKDTTVVWVEALHKPGQWPSYVMLVYDQAKSGSVATEYSSSSHVTNVVEIQGFELNNFPRWDKKTILRFRDRAGSIAEGQIVISIPSTACWGIGRSIRCRSPKLTAILR